MAKEGTPDEWHLVHLGSRAIGGPALVMTEMTDVSAEGRISLGCTGMYAPEHVAAWRRITDFVHSRSRAKVGMSRSVMLSAPGRPMSSAHCRSLRQAVAGSLPSASSAFQPWVAIRSKSG